MTDSELLGCFTHEADGSWLCIKPVLLGGSGRNSGLMPGVRVSHTDIYMGHHLAHELEEAEARQSH